MLVFMDLVSGYILFEEVADDRTYETWYGRVKARLAPMKTRVLSLVSDRAKALIKLAETGLECPSIPDVFHLLYDLVKGYSLAIASQVKAAHQALSQAQAHLDKLQASGTSETEPQAAQSAVAACEAEVSHWEQCALSDIFATSPDNLAKNRVKMAIESRRRHFYAFEFYKIWYLYIYINYIYKF
jgi:hypothetical protein